MKKMSLYIMIVIVLLVTCSPGLAFIDHYVNVEITQESDGLKAAVECDFMLSGMDCFTVYYPVPPDANNIIFGFSEPVHAHAIYSNHVLPEQLYWPMIEGSYCCIDTCPITIVWPIYYEHYLLKRPGNEYIFFYPNMSSDDPESEDWPHGRLSANYFIVDFPANYQVKSVTVGIGKNPVDYNVTDNRLEFYIDYNDTHYERIIVTLKRRCDYILAGDLK